MYYSDGDPISVRADRYEFWLYRQLRKRLKSGEIYLDDSLQHYSLTAELVPLDQTADIFGKMEISWLHQPLSSMRWR